MNLKMLLSLESEHTLTAEDCELLNQDLSLKGVIDIPVENREQIKDYLVMTLNMNSVQASIKGKLDTLLTDLQNV